MAYQHEAIDISLYFQNTEGKLHLEAVEDGAVPVNIITPMGLQNISRGSFNFTAGCLPNSIITDRTGNAYLLKEMAVIRGHRARSLRSTSEAFYLAERVRDGPGDMADVLLARGSEYTKPPPDNAIRATKAATLDKQPKGARSIQDQKATETAPKKEEKDQKALEEAKARRAAKASNNKKPI